MADRSFGNVVRPNAGGTGPDLSVVLVNYNGRRFLAACLESLLAGAGSLDVEVIMVDNASTDGSLELVRKRHPGIQVICSAVNQGFGRANNVGARKAASDFILFLNTDTRIDAGALEELVSWMKGHPEAGAAGPVLYGPGGRCQVSFGGPRTFFRELWAKILGNRLMRDRIGRLRQPLEAEWVSGAALLVRKRAFQEAGGFDERFFLYFEDIDLCRRIRSAGWRIGVVPAARIFHEGGASIASLSRRGRYHYRRSQVLYYRLYNSGFSRLFLRLGLGLAAVGLTVRGMRAGSNDKTLCRDYFRLVRKGDESDEP